MPDMQKLFPTVSYCDSAYDAVTGADCIVILTEWDEIKALDYGVVAELCNKRVLFDTRNICNPAVMQQYDFTYVHMGQ
jgi:UDPglucose 6-dehydrogenase